MKCKKCNTVNLVKANYCVNCGNPFSRREKEKAEKLSAVNVLKTTDDINKKYKKAKSYITGSIITGNTYVRLALLIVPFVFTLLFGGGAGNGKMKIAESDAYEIYYNTSTDEYFLTMENNTVDLQLYVPEDTQRIKVTYSGTGQCFTYTTDRAVTLTAQSAGFYTVEAVAEGGNQQIVLYTVMGGADNG